MCGLQEQWLRADHDFDLVTEWDRGVALLLPRLNETQLKQATGQSKLLRRGEADLG